MDVFPYWYEAARGIPPDILADIVNAMNAPEPVTLPRRLARWIGKPRGNVAVIAEMGNAFAKDIRTMLGE